MILGLVSTIENISNTIISLSISLSETNTLLLVFSVRGSVFFYWGIDNVGLVKMIFFENFVIIGRL